VHAKILILNWKTNKRMIFDPIIMFLLEEVPVAFDDECSWRM